MIVHEHPKRFTLPNRFGLNPHRQYFIAKHLQCVNYTSFEYITSFVWFFLRADFAGFALIHLGLIYVYCLRITGLKIVSKFTLGGITPLKG